MTEPSDLHESVEVAIRVLRHDLLSAGRNASWEDFRQRIRHLLIARRPSRAERLQLLELYDDLVTVVERGLRVDMQGLERVGRQRAVDVMAFNFAEAREPGGVFSTEIAAASIERERVAGRLRVDGYLLELVSWILQEVEAEDGRTPPGDHEDPAAFFPTRLMNSRLLERSLSAGSRQGNSKDR
jgi:hypothetical protein